MAFKSSKVTTCLVLSEFDFVVMGHEFDHYQKKMIRDIRNWDWFLEEHKEDSGEDEEDEVNDDEDDNVWTGESEKDPELIKKLKVKVVKILQRVMRWMLMLKMTMKMKMMKRWVCFIVDDEDAGEGIDEDENEETEEDDEDVGI
ncbi:hypothetical protein Tco_0783720 [Tanacetum coccineum]